MERQASRWGAEVLRAWKNAAFWCLADRHEAEFQARVAAHIAELRAARAEAEASAAAAAEREASFEARLAAHLRAAREEAEASAAAAAAEEADEGP